MHLERPPTCCNAFPVVDVSGPAQPQNNWLFGLNCGSFGCPPNGGWSTFREPDLPLPPHWRHCDPHDLVVRLSQLHAGRRRVLPRPAACAKAMATTDCTNAGGTPRGDGTDCTGANCPQPSGACCFGNGFCSIFAQSDCAGAGGTFLGANTVCGSGNTCPTGACCLPSGSCISGVTGAACTSQAGRHVPRCGQFLRRGQLPTAQRGSAASRAMVSAR